jgi:hypothetical protein
MVPRGGPRHSVCMSDTILFELPDPDAAEHLCKRLRPQRGEWLLDGGGVWLVIAELLDEDRDLARLLREIETWVTEQGLSELWFQLDGRSYLLEPGKTEPAAVAA